MITPLLLLALAQSTAAVPVQVAGEFLPNRLDCHASTSDWFDGRSAAAGSVSYTFIFPINRRESGRRPTIQWVMTLDDARSWVKEGALTSLNAAGWPAFSADVQVGGTFVYLRSDASTPGRISFRSLYFFHHGGESRGEGNCHFLPENSDGQTR